MKIVMARSRDVVPSMSADQGIDGTRESPDESFCHMRRLQEDTLGRCAACRFGDPLSGLSWRG